MLLMMRKKRAQDPPSSVTVGFCIAQDTIHAAFYSTVQMFVLVLGHTTSYGSVEGARGFLVFMTT